MGYRIRRVDANQKVIVNRFRKLGAKVLILSELGKGCPDICASYGGVNYLFEIKDGSKSPSHQLLTLAEHDFFNTWLGHVAIIKSEEEVDRFMEAIRGSSNQNKNDCQG